MRAGWARAVGPASLALLLLALLGLAGRAEHDPVDEVRVSAAAAVFPLSGAASGLFPGKARPLTVTVTNRHRFRIRVISLNVRVKADPGKPGCRPGLYIRVSPLSRPFTVQRRSRGRTTLYMRMSRSAPNVCKRAQFPLVFSAEARRP